MRQLLTIFMLFFACQISAQDISGMYYVNGKSSNVITISKIDGDNYKISTNEGWSGVGMLYAKDGKKTLMTVFKYDKPGQVYDRGVHGAVLQANGNFEVSIRLWGDIWNTPKNNISTVKWIKQK